ncbi:MAG: hypothetical protein HC781_15805 [Leptolyngbyaceae cyanobacterium CSU_1_4]|nr:hypothetical protein [Leptolyngbyaceae cyanobacterium CSU_1_4]
MPSWDDISGDKITELRSMGDRLSHPDHPVQKNCDRLESVAVMRAIEGKGL